MWYHGSVTPRVAVFAGTRPECVKIAPLVRALGASCDLIAVTQHKELLVSHINEQGLVPKQWVEIERKTGSLTELMGAAIDRLGSLVSWGEYACAVVQGDTATAFAAAQAAFLNGVPVAHVEAGLRSPLLTRPFPEEMHRRAISRIATWHFAPTRLSAANLRQERVDGGIYQVGNTGIDAFRQAIASTIPSLVSDIVERAGIRPLVLVTCHRRESWEKTIPALVDTLRALPPDLLAVWPAHGNPKLADVLKTAVLPGNVLVTPPLEHVVTAQLVERCALVVTDSGGLIEESADAEKPCLILRGETERPEAIDNACKLVGDNVEDLPKMMAVAIGCYRNSRGRFGDGHAAPRIAKILLRDL